ncbi:Uma2 family endonuclease [Catenovulum maritimum]|uniref:Uma2 family endonuclease n=1 Tax=Catenovulum maritimum TaxID=1513271 RepID=UPI000AF35F10|nr:Uma2 family endonuclease [Catenovulum maritimum]
MVDCNFDESTPYYTDTPIIIVEVISKPPRKTDEQTKRLEYINLPNLKKYVIIEQDYVEIAVFRKSDQWCPTHYFLGEEITFEAIDLTLPDAEIYKRVQADVCDR